MSRDYIIRCDMEGVGGVVSYEQARPGAPEYPKAQEWFMAELVALVEGLKQGGAGRVVVYDEHYWGRNIDVARLPQGTRGHLRQSLPIGPIGPEDWTSLSPE